MIIDAFAGNVVVFSQTIHSNISGQSVHQALLLSQTVRKNILLQSVANRLDLHSRYSLRRSVTSTSVVGSLTLSQSLARVKFAEVVQAVGMYHSVRTNDYERPNQTLTLAQSIEAWVGQTVSDTIEFSDSADYDLRKALIITQTLTMVSSQTAYKPSKRFVIEPIPITPTSHTVFNNVTGTILTFRNPEFGNVERLDFSRIIRRSRAGDLIIYRSPSWPASETMVLTFANLSQTDVWKLIDFMNKNIGLSVLYNDHLGRHWVGYIMTPAAQASEQYNNGFTISLEFQGRQL